MMAISDIYDALTATDRPYKKAVPHTLALDILKKEADSGQLDGELFTIFVEAEVPKRRPEGRPRSAEAQRSTRHPDPLPEGRRPTGCSSSGSAADGVQPQAVDLPRLPDRRAEDDHDPVALAAPGRATSSSSSTRRTIASVSWIGSSTRGTTPHSSASRRRTSWFGLKATIGTGGR